MNTTKIGFIGAGNMAGSLIKGLVSQGHNPEHIWACDIDSQKLQTLAEDCGIQTAEAGELVRTADIVVLAIKPQVMAQICGELAAELPESPPLIVSIAAGINAKSIEQWLKRPVPLVRCMPNTPALIGLGASGLYANALVNKSQKEQAEQILSAVGIAVWVTDEAGIDAVTAVSGSGPAYFFLFIEAMQEAAVKLGLDSDTARALVNQTAVGAAQLASQSEHDVATLRRQVTSPGGTTEQAIAAFESGELRSLVETALQSAYEKSIALAKELGE